MTAKIGEIEIERERDRERERKKERERGKILNKNNHWFCWRDEQKIFYNRSTNSVAFFSLNWMSFQPPFPSMQLK